MQKRSKYLITAVLALGISGTVFGFGAHHHFSQMSLQDKSEMVQLRISQKLDLDDVQQAKLSELEVDFFAGNAGCPEHHTRSA